MKILLRVLMLFSIMKVEVSFSQKNSLTLAVVLPYESRNGLTSENFGIARYTNASLSYGRFASTFLYSSFGLSVSSWDYYNQGMNTLTFRSQYFSLQPEVQLISMANRFPKFGLSMHFGVRFSLVSNSKMKDALENNLYSTHVAQEAIYYSAMSVNYELKQRWRLTILPFSIVYSSNRATFSNAPANNELRVTNTRLEFGQFRIAALF